MSDIAQPAESKPITAKATQKYLRFTVAERFEHWIFMISFTILGITGLVQKFANSPISKTIVVGLGGVENTRLIHHTAAVVMMIVSVYHIGAVGYRIYVERKRLTMLPGTNDARNAWQALRYYGGLIQSPPQQGRYTFEEKAEYWAVVWGTVIMVVTGFMMWNPIATTNFLPGQVIPASKVAHGAEAVLAILAILLWHMYHVIIKHINKSMFKGNLTEEEMLHEHPLELADIKAGIEPPHVNPKEVTVRRRKYLPISSVITAGLLIGIYFFVTFEKTALITVPPSEQGQVEVFVPLPPTPLPTLPPTPTAAAVTALNWEAGIGPLLSTKCGACHNSTAKIGGLDLSTYQGTLDGGKSGPAVVPGDSTASRLMVIQSAGGHPGQLSSEELAQVEEWIKAGAVEK